MSASGSPARRSRRPGSPAVRTSSRSSTSASRKAARSSSWSTSAAARSRTASAAAGSRPGRRSDWLEQAAVALDAAHAEGVVHRDVKPANLLLDGADNVHVADFGIASAAGMDSLTKTGTVIGTAAYLSPEQAQGERATPASDRYALAVVAWELLTGRRPFGGDTPAAEAAAHVHAEVPAIGDAAPGPAAGARRVSSRARSRRTRPRRYAIRRRVRRRPSRRGARRRHRARPCSHATPVTRARAARCRSSVAARRAGRCRARGRGADRVGRRRRRRRQSGRGRVDDGRPHRDGAGHDAARHRHRAGSRHRPQPQPPAPSGLSVAQARALQDQSTSALKTATGSARSSSRSKRSRRCETATEPTRRTRTTTSASRWPSSAAATRRSPTSSAASSCSARTRTSRPRSSSAARDPALAPGRLDDRRALLERLPPLAVRGVPAHRVGEPVLELPARLPAELLSQLGGVEQVAAVVSRAVGNDRLQVARLAGQVEDRVGDLLDRRLEPRADVVGLADPRPRAARARSRGSGRRRAAIRACSGVAS